MLLFNDTFTNHYDPEIGLAALDVLSAAGLRPALAPNRCCGRPADFEGLLDDARAMAARNADLLFADANAGRSLRLLRAELSLGDSRGCAGAAAGRGATAS